MQDMKIQEMTAVHLTVCRFRQTLLRYVRLMV